MPSDPRQQPQAEPEAAADGTGVYVPAAQQPGAAPADGTGVYVPPGAKGPATSGADEPTLDLDGNSPAHAPGPDATAEGGTGVYVPASPGVADGATVDLPASRAPADGATGVYVPGNTKDAAGQSVNGATVDLPAGQSVNGATVDLPSRGDAAHAVTTRAPAGTSAERYVPKRFHAKGGMGEIWLAEDCDIGRQVALKKMLGAAQQEQKDRFLVEARITGQLEHPGIVPIHELGTDPEGQPYYVMKFVHGRTLKKVIKEYHSPESKSDVPREVQHVRLLQIFLDLCQTVAYAHSRGVLHRDLKPDNVMLGAYGETLLLDWGIAKVQGQPDAPATGAPSDLPPVNLSYAGVSTETMAGSIMGSPFYMAPEMAEGRTDLVDHQSDIYLLGATLYEILTGKPPRSGGNALKLLEKARTEVPLPPRHLIPDLPRALEAICQKAMAHDKGARYARTADLADDVKRYLAGEPVTAYRENWQERAWRWMRRHKKAIVRVVGAAVVIAAAYVGYTVLDKAWRDRAEAQREAERLQKQDEARQALKEFRSKADEARYYAANSGPEGENSPYYDAARGEAAAQAALAVADGWGPDVSQLPLAEEQQPVRKELFDLLLLLAQEKERATAGPEASREALALLNRAHALGESSRGYHRLRAEAWRAQGDGERAKEEERLAEYPAVPSTALDEFLQGEKERTRVVAGADGKRPPGPAQPDRDGLLKAIGHYRAALKDDPKHYWSHFQLGRCYLALGQDAKGQDHTAEAVEALGTCVTLRPEAPWGYSLRGFVLARRGEFKEAEWNLDQAVRLSPGLRLAQLNRGFVYAFEKKFDLALADYNAVLKEPDDQRLVEAFYYRGLLWLQRGDKEKGDQQKALEDFDRVIAEKPDFRAAYRLRALIRLAEGKDDRKGLDDINAFLAAGGPWDRDSGTAHALVGSEVHKMIDELQEIGRQWPEGTRQRLLMLAADELRQGIEKGGGSAAVSADYGSVLENLGKVADAVQAYSKGLEAAPKDVKLLVKRGWAYDALRQADKAGDDFEAAAHIEPKNAEAHTGLGYIEARRKQHAEARREANLALLHGAGDYLILHNVACIYAALSRTDVVREAEYQDLAIDQLRQAVALRKRGGKGPDEIRLIEREPAFPRALRDRPEFLDLLKGEP